LRVIKLGGYIAFPKDEGRTDMPIDPESQIDHFKIWEMPKQHFTRDYELKDQFHTDDTFNKSIDQIEWIANPVKKDGKRIHHRWIHLTGYSLKAPKEEKDRQPGRTIRLTNQFTKRKHYADWTLGDIKYLLLPASKVIHPDKDLPDIPDEIDHFLCYDATGEPVGDLNTNLQDQFDEIRHGGRTETITKLTPKYFGVPVEKNGSVLVHKDAHLAIYALDPAEAVLDIQISTRDQCTILRDVLVKQPLYLAVPSLKTGWKVLPRAEAPGAGQKPPQD
jgi:hypothetical protein